MDMWTSINGNYLNLEPIWINGGKLYPAPSILTDSDHDLFESLIGFHYKNDDEWMYIDAPRYDSKRRSVMKEMIDMYCECGDWKVVFECMGV